MTDKPSYTVKILNYDTGRLYTVSREKLDALIQSNPLYDEKKPESLGNDYINIPFPVNMPSQAGVFSTVDTVKSVRLTRDELKAINATAGAIGMTSSMFMRWCAVFASKIIEGELPHVISTGRTPTESD